LQAHGQYFQPIINVRDAAPWSTVLSFAPTYLVCATQRSGSTLLCRLLAETRVAGMGASRVGGYEHLVELVGDVAPARDWSEFDLGTCLADYFERSRSPNGVGGFKLMWSHVMLVARAQRAVGKPVKPSDLFNQMPPGTLFVWLSRRDVLRQAISLTRAVQTQCWTTKSHSDFPGRASFDYLRIISSERWLKAHNESWRQFFAQPDSPKALEVFYEDLVRNPQRELRRILEYIGVEAPEQIEGPDSASQRSANGMSDEWMDRVQRIRARGRIGEACAQLCSLPRWLASSVVGQFRLRRRVRMSRAVLRDKLDPERESL